MGGFRLTLLGPILGVASGLVFALLLLFGNKFDNLKTFYLLLDLPTTFLVMPISKLFGLQEGYIFLYLFVAPIVGGLEGYLFGLFFDNVIGEKFKNLASVGLIILTLLLNCIPLYNSEQSSSSLSKTKEFSFVPKEISVGQFQLDVLNVMDDSQSIRIPIAFFEPDGEYQNILYVTKLSFDVYKDNSRLNLTTKKFDGHMIIIDSLKPPFVLKIHKAELTSNISNKNYKVDLNMDVTVTEKSEKFF